METEGQINLFDQPKVYSVKEINQLLKRCIEDTFGYIWVSGEISSFTRHSSGHCYITLKEEDSNLNAVMWRSVARRLKFDLNSGLEVLAYGNLTTYPLRSQYQLIISKIEPKGIGPLELAFRQLKEKLEKEGLFSDEYKKELPYLPHRIGIVTSPTGAAIRDMLEVIYKRFPNVETLIYPARVQGEGAAEEISEGIEELNKIEDIDVIIIGRGGGSLEDLWAFNEEIVARSIFTSKIPIISAVGHEVDISISDLVADKRALTPTGAGETVVPEKEHIVEKLEKAERAMKNSLTNKTALIKERLNSLKNSYGFKRPLELVRQNQQKLDEISLKFKYIIENIISKAKERINSLSIKLEALSPLKILNSGYSITMKLKGEKPIKDASEVKKDEEILTKLANGEIISKVDKVKF